MRFQKISKQSLLALMVLSTTVFVTLCVQKIFLFPLRTEAKITANQFREVEGKGQRVNIPKEYAGLLKRGWVPTVFEDSQQLTPRVYKKDEVIAEGGGRYRVDDRSVWLSARDNSKPSDNGRSYFFGRPVLVSWGWLFLSGAVTVGLWIFWALQYGRGQESSFGEAVKYVAAPLFLVLKKGLRLAKNSATDLLGYFSHNKIRCRVVAILFLALFLPSLYLLLQVPVCYLNTDAAIFIEPPIKWGDWTIIPHYPPLYPLFTRSVLWLAAHTFATPPLGVSTALQGNLSYFGLTSIVIIQHVLFCLFAALLIERIAKNWLSRALGVLPFLSCALLYYNQHAITTEALLLVGQAFLIYAAYRVLAREQPKLRHYFYYAVATYITVQIRYPGLIFAGFLPAAALFAFMFDRKNLSYFRKFLFSSVAVILAVFCSGTTTRLVEYALNIEHAPPLGRPGSIVFSWADFPNKQARVDFAEQLKSRTDDPHMKVILDHLFKQSGRRYDSWRKADAFTKNYLTASYGNDHILATEPNYAVLTARYLKRAYFLYLTQFPNPPLWNFVAESCGVNFNYLRNNEKPDFYIEETQLLLSEAAVKKPQDFVKFWSPRAAELQKTFRSVSANNITMSMHKLMNPKKSLFLAAGMLLVLLFFGRRFTLPVTTLFLSILLLSFLYFIAVSALTLPFFRYMLPIYFNLIFAAGIFLASINFQKNRKITADQTLSNPEKKP